MMDAEMICVEKNCDGKIDKKNTRLVMTGCSSRSIACTCEKCGRLHWPNGKPVFNRGGEKVFFGKEGQPRYV